MNVERCADPMRIMHSSTMASTGSTFHTCCLYRSDLTPSASAVSWGRAGCTRCTLSPASLCVC